MKVSSKLSIPTINAAGLQRKGIILSWVISFYIKMTESMMAIGYTNLGQQKVILTTHPKKEGCKY